MAINFPAFPATGDTYSYGGFTYNYDGEKWTTTSAGDNTPIALASGFIGSVEWYNGFRDKIPAGYVAADGQLLDRAAEPALWAEVEAGRFAVVTDAIWLDTGEASGYPQKAYSRASYSTGDESTTFRVPDLNGIQENSIHALFLRGAGNTGQPGMSPGGSGTVRASSAPNITGTVITRPTVNNAGADATMMLDAYGALEIQVTDSPGTIGYKLDTATPLNQEQFSIDASLSHEAFGRDGTEEVRPNSATGIWIIRSSAVFAKSGDFVESTGDTMTGNLWVELEDTTAEPHIGVIRDERQLYLYDSGTAYGLRTLNPDASNIILISRNAATDDVFVGDGAAAVHIDNPNSASPQGMGITSLTRKDYVDTTFLPKTGGVLSNHLIVDVGSGEPHLTVRKDGRELFMYDSGSNQGLYSLHPNEELPNIALISRSIDTGDVNVGGNTVYTRIYSPICISAQGTGGDSLTRKDYVDATILFQAERIDALLTRLAEAEARLAALESV